MKLRMLWLGPLFVLVCTGLVFGGEGPPSEKDTAAAEAEPKAKESGIETRHRLAGDEKVLVDKAKQSRDEYHSALKELKKFYEESGNYPRLKKVRTELEDLELVRTSDYQNWEDLIGHLKPEKDIPEARELYEQGEGLRNAIAISSRKKEAKLKEAVVKYRQLIEQYPDSELVDEAAYRLGTIHSTIYFGNYWRAAKFYQYCFEWNPKTELQARYMAAQIYRRKLHEYEEAAKLYWLSSLYTVRFDLRKDAKRQFKLLEREGYGKDVGEKSEESKPSKE